MYAYIIYSWKTEEQPVENMCNLTVEWYVQNLIVAICCDATTSNAGVIKIKVLIKLNKNYYNSSLESIRCIFFVNIIYLIEIYF